MTSHGETITSFEVVRPSLKNTLHSNGHTFCEYDVTSNTLLSCNHADNEIYLLKPEHLESEQETRTHTFGEDSSLNVTFVKIADEFAFVAFTNYTVQIYSYPQFEKEGLLVRFGSTPTCVDLNQDKSFAVIGTADGTVKTVELSSPHRFKTFEGHTGPILSVCYDPSEDYIVTSSCDGSIKVWKCGDKKCVKTWEDYVPKSNDFENSKTLAQTCWQPSCGSHLVIPGDKWVKFHDRRSQSFLESPKFTFTHVLLNELVSMVCWHGTEVPQTSSSGSSKGENNIIAFVTVASDVLLAEFVANQCQLLRCVQGKQNKVTCFVWIANNSVNFVVGDEIGMVYYYTDLIPNKSRRDESSKLALASSESGKGGATNSAAANETVRGADEILDEMAVKQKSSFYKSTAQGGNDDDDDGSISLDQIKQSYALEVERGPSDENISSSQERVSSGLDGTGTSGVASVQRAPVVELINYQAPFQSSCSPTSLLSRYMKWNLVGIVRREESSVRDDDDDDMMDNELNDNASSITVEFHDSTFHHAIHLNDEHGYTLADLSEEALLLASPSSTSLDNKASIITCNTFSFWDHSNQWSSELPQGEKALTVCLGTQSWLAVATSAGHLRIFTVSGIQLTVIMLPGHLVSIAGGLNELLYVYQPSQTFERDRFYCASIYEVTGFEVNLSLTEQFPLCQADDHVVWLGFSQEGDAVVAFNSGPVYMLKRDSSSLGGSSSRHGQGHCWLPVFNFKQYLTSKSDRIWIVGLTGKQLRGIYCKATKFPAQLPKPIVLTYPLGLPLCNVESEQTQMEMELQTHRAFNTLSTPELQRTFLKLFALACRTDRDCRAVDICKLMPDEETVILAIKYATKLKKLTLAQKLSAIAHEKGNIQQHNNEFNHPNLHRQQSFNVFDEDDNSRSLFGSSQSFENAAQRGGGSGTMGSSPMEDETDVELIKNNPLKRASSKSSFLTNNTSDISVNETTSSVFGTTLTDRKQPPRKNPFAVPNRSSSLINLSSEGGRSASVGSSVFDDMRPMLKPDKLKGAEGKSLPSRKRSSVTTSSTHKNGDSAVLVERENKNPTEVKKKSTPFQIYFDQIKPSLQDEFPEKSSEELLPIAMKRWKKAKTTESEENGGGNKRRADECENVEASSNVGSNNTSNQFKKSKFDSGALLEQFRFN